MTIRTVALIGAGNMGSRMARCIKRAGFDLTICDQDPSVLEAFKKEGMTVTQDPQDCASADAIIVLVANDEQIISVTCGPTGFIAAIPPEHQPLVCIMSTTLPSTLKQIAAGLKHTRAHLIDAPVSGGLVKAELGTLTIMMSGDDQDLDRAEPLMRSMGTEIFRCGALGAAEVIKVINNMLGIASIYLAAEAFELAAKHGVSIEQIAPILEVSSGRNFMSLDGAMTRQHYQAWARSPEAFFSLVNIVSKDLHLAKALADEVKLDLPLLNEVSLNVDATDQTVMKRWMLAAGQKVT
jgi:3-hydroxyisobutyrate dehydrogenase-like beta-hydroxyacid dehydrogenase